MLDIDLQTVFGPEVCNDRVGVTMAHPVVVLQHGHHL